MKARNFSIFLALAYTSAFFVEEITRTILSQVHIWQIGLYAIPFFFGWYGLLFAVTYFLFVKKPVKYSVAFGIIIGMLAETFLFHQMNAISVFIFPVLYGLTFYLPFKIISRLSN